MVYADWLMERGDPRGELIALQCAGPEGETRGSRVDRLCALLEPNGHRWLGPLAGDHTVGFHVSGDVIYIEIKGYPAGSPKHGMQIDRGFSAHPLCVTREQLHAGGQALIRLSPTLYATETEAFDDRLWYRAHQAQVLSARGVVGRAVISRPPEHPQLDELSVQSLDVRRAASLDVLNELFKGTLAASQHLIRYLGPAYWGPQGDLAVAREKLDGWNLEALVEHWRNAPTPIQPALACEIVRQLCRGLHRMHRARLDKDRPAEIVHGAVHPRHVQISPQGLVKHTDIYLASINRYLLPHPERDRYLASNRDPDSSHRPWAELSLYHRPGESKDPRSDVYACGTLLYELLSLTHPLPEARRQIAASLSPAAAERRFRPLSSLIEVPAQLEGAVDRATARDLGERHETILELHVNLEAIAKQQGWSAGAGFVAREIRRSLG